MRLDVRPLLRGEISRMDLSFTLNPPAPDGITFPDGADLSGVLEMRAGYMTLDARITVRYAGFCARCLSPVTGVFEVPFNRTAVTKGTLTEEQEDENVDEYVITVGGFLDLDDPVCETVVLSFPSRLLCSDDCPGLCPRCGKPRREGSCGCPEEKAVPGQVRLKDFMSD